MIREIIQTLACLSVLNGSTLSLHLTNDRSADHSSSSSSGSPPMPNTGGTLQHHSNNPYRRMAAAAESERMLFMGGGRHGRPIITGRLHLTSGDTDGGGGGGGSDGGGGDELNYQPSSLTMLQDNEFPIRREPFFFDEDDGGDGGGGGGGGIGGGGVGYGAYRHPSPDHYHHRYDDGSYEIMEDIFNRGEGIYRKFPPIHHQAAQYHEPAPRGLQELFEQHENGATAAAADDEITPNHRVDIRYKQKSQRKRTQLKQNPDKLSTKPDSSSGSSSSSSGSVGKAEAAAAASQPSASAQEQQQNTNQQQQQQQLLHPSNSNNKRSGIGSPPVTHSIASQLMLRSPRGQRQYDVPQIECPSAIDGMERFACPTPDRQGRYRCIDDHVLCDGFLDCPEGEDEDRRSCMFYKTTRAHLDVLADALLRWARGR